MANTKKRKAEPAKKAAPAKKQKVEPKKQKVEAKVKPGAKSAKKGSPKKVVSTKKTPVSKEKKPNTKTKANSKTEKAVKKKPVKEATKGSAKKGAVKKTPKKKEKKEKSEKKKKETKPDVKKKLALPKEPVNKKIPVKKSKQSNTAAKAKQKIAQAKLKAAKRIIKKTTKATATKVAKKEVNIPKKATTDRVTKTKPVKPGKRKADSSEEETPRKRRVITPNKKYADFEVGVSPKKVSELRAFIQDKKKDPIADVEKMEKPEAKDAEAKPKIEIAVKAEEVKVIKPSEMKPAEKLLKKLQKKLEREAKAASVTKPENKVNKDNAKFKITKIVTYNKKPPLMAKAKALTKNLVAKQKAPILKSAKVVPVKSQVTKEKQVAKPTKPTPTKAKPAQNGNGKGTPTKVQQILDTAKAKKIKELKREERPIQAEFVCQKNVRFSDDPNQNSWITGIDVFPSGEIVLVDMGNKKIKLFTSDFEKSSQVKLDTIPQDLSISPIDASSAYFTKPFSKEGIQKLSMSDGVLTLRESFFTNGTNRGITCTKAGILTSVQDGRYHDLDINCFKIDLLDYEGKILKSVSMDGSGNRLFKLPLYFAVDHTGKQVIVSDCIRNNSYIISLDLTGKIAFKYTGIQNNMITPRGLTVDEDDNVYVTEWENHNVYILSPTGKRLQILFNNAELKEQGLDGLLKPYQLCYKKQENGGRLIVSQEGCNTVKVFRVFKKQNVPESAESKGVVEEVKNTEPSSSEGQSSASSGTTEVAAQATPEGSKTEENSQEAKSGDVSC